MKLNTAYIKIFGAFVVVFGLGLLMGYFMNDVFAAYSFKKLIYFSVSLVFFAIALSIGSIVIENKWLALAFGIGAAATPLLFFYRTLPFIWLAGVSAVMAFYILSAQGKMRISLSNSFKVRYFSLANKFIFRTLNAVAIFAIAAFLATAYQNLALIDARGSVSGIPIRSGFTVADAIARSLPQEAAQLPQALKTELLKKAFADVVKMLDTVAPRSGIALGDDVLTAAIKFISAYIKTRSLPMQILIIVSIVGFLLAIARVVLYAASPIIVFIGWFVFEGLLSLGFFSIILVSKSQEKIILNSRSAEKASF